MNKVERTKMVKAMEFICRQINDEFVFDGWLMTGVADEDIEYGDLSDYPIDDAYTEDECFKQLMACFLRRMKRAGESGGLVCDDIVANILD